MSAQEPAGWAEVVSLPLQPFDAAGARERAQALREVAAAERELAEAVRDRMAIEVMRERGVPSPPPEPSRDEVLREQIGQVVAVLARLLEEADDEELPDGP